MKGPSFSDFHRRIGNYNLMEKPNDKLLKALRKTWKQFSSALYIIFIIFSIIALLQNLLPSDFYSSLFINNSIIDSITGALLGSISFGNPIGSYVIGGELVKQGVNLIAITAFLLAWVTVGIVQIPVEVHFFGKKFALVRNLASFFASILLAIIINGIVSIW